MAHIKSTIAIVDHRLDEHHRFELLSALLFVAMPLAGRHRITVEGVELVAKQFVGHRQAVYTQHFYIWLHLGSHLACGPTNKRGGPAPPYGKISLSYTSADFRERRDRRLQFVECPRSDRRTSPRKLPQVIQAPKLNQPCIRDLRLVKFQAFEFWEPGDHFQAKVVDLGPAKAEPLELRHVLERSESSPRDLAPSQVQPFEPGHSAEVDESGIRDFRLVIVEGEPREPSEIPQVRQVPVADIDLIEV